MRRTDNAMAKGFEFRTLVAISINCTGSCKSNYHKITTTTAPTIKQTMIEKTNKNVYFRQIKKPSKPCQIQEAKYITTT